MRQEARVTWFVALHACGGSIHAVFRLGCLKWPVSSRVRNTHAVKVADVCFTEMQGEVPLNLGLRFREFWHPRAHLTLTFWLLDGWTMKNPLGKYFLSGAIYTGLGLLILAPLTYQDLSQINIVGPFFGILIGATFLYVGITRIKKSREQHHVTDLPQSHQKDGKPPGPVHGPDKNKLEHKKPLTERKEPWTESKEPIPWFVIYVALSPIVPLGILLIAKVSCSFIRYETLASCIGNSNSEALAYLGVLGWFVSIPVAGLLLFVYAASK